MVDSLTEEISVFKKAALKRRCWMKRGGSDNTMNPDEIMFLGSHPSALPLYDQLRSCILATIPDARIEVKKTQISFFMKHMFAAVSFTPVRKAKDRPEPFLTVTFGLPYRVTSQRIDASAEPYPGRWTHHVMIGSGKEINEELMGWIREAAAFSSRKR